MSRRFGCSGGAGSGGRRHLLRVLLRSQALARQAPRLLDHASISGWVVVLSGAMRRPSVGQKRLRARRSRNQASSSCVWLATRTHTTPHLHYTARRAGRLFPEDSSGQKQQHRDALPEQPTDRNLRTPQPVGKLDTVVVHMVQEFDAMLASKRAVTGCCAECKANLVPGMATMGSTNQRIPVESETVHMLLISPNEPKMYF